MNGTSRTSLASERRCGARRVAGIGLADWFRRYVSSTEELATSARQEHLRQWVGRPDTTVIPPRTER